MLTSSVVLWFALGSQMAASPGPAEARTRPTWGGDTLRLVCVGARVVAVAARPAGDVTRTSDYCVACHDGTVATSRLRHEAAVSSSRMAPGLGAHPIDVSYPICRLGFVPLTSLDDRLRLEAGRITCTTCHAAECPASTLAIPNGRSRLCLACHVK